MLVGKTPRKRKSPECNKTCQGELERETRGKEKEAPDCLITYGQATV